MDIVQDPDNPSVPNGGMDTMNIWKIRTLLDYLFPLRLKLIEGILTQLLFQFQEISAEKHFLQHLDFCGYSFKIFINPLLVVSKNV